MEETQVGAENGIRNGEGERREIRKKAKHLAVNTAKDWIGRDVATYASSIAFYFFMSMIPLLIIILQLLPRIGLSQWELLDFINRLIPETAQGFAATIVSEAYRTAKGAISASALAILWSASRGTMALRCGLNKVYDEEERRSYPVLCLISIGYTAVMIVAFSVMLFLVFAGPVSHFLLEKMPDIFQKTVTLDLWQRILVIVLMTLILVLVYTFVPAGHRRFHRQLPGALLVTLMWNIFSWLFSIYVRGYNAYTMFYGSLGTIAIFLFWLYCCFYILLIGAFFNRFCGDQWERAKRLIRRIREKRIMGDGRD